MRMTSPFAPIRQTTRFRVTSASRMVSPAALMVGLLAAMPATAQDVTIADGQTVTGTVTLANEGDVLIIEQGGALDIAEGDAAFGDVDNHVFTNNGTITAGDDGIDATGDNAEISNSGVITVGSDGIVSRGTAAMISNSGVINADAGDNGIFSTGTAAVISNSWEITAVDDGIDATGDAAEISNSGVITADDDGIFSSGGAAEISNSGEITAVDDGIDATGDAAEISNSGVITADDDGIFSSGGAAVITNSGAITAVDDGIDATDAATVISNSGEITAVDNGIDASGDAAEISNSGVITADDDGIESRGDNAVVTNSGVITTLGDETAAINMQGADGQLTNTGLLSAVNGFAVSGNAGSQTVVLGTGSQILGAFDLGAGDDSVTIAGADTSSVLAMQGVENITIAEGIAGFVQTDGDTSTVTIVDLTGPSVLNDAVALRNASAHQTLNAQVGDPQSGTSGAWASLFGTSRTRGDDGVALAYDHSLAGVMAGYDTTVGGNRLGFVGGVSNSQITTESDASDITTESLFGGAYLGTRLGQLDVTASLLAGVDSYDSERLVLDNIAGFEAATGQFDGSFVSAGVQVTAGSFTLGGVQVQPSALATYTATSFDAYTEEGTTNANLDIDSRTAQTLTARGQLEATADLYGIDVAYRVGIDGRFSSEDDITLSLGDESQSFAAADSDTVLGGFLGARATFVQADQLRLTGDVEYGFAEGGDQFLAASLNVSFSF
ncbi:autotransporter domain-containing protein [Octadecabacter sp. G9-8]|uniref:Autotransporter domain-containing protein n=1 Tax=Octadecabacter dasysiphoniae TaxID=2909341 RepID=A0ABS9D0H8_9RHOB|nr:autotransporter domain-containing protein [Octadecabacter dasysiphoniae]MCF2873035.1 autotransporter domain-containing protein [Octadecabacter dasysiphoniae]